MAVKARNVRRIGTTKWSLAKMVSVAVVAGAAAGAVVLGGLTAAGVLGSTPTDTATIQAPPARQPSIDEINAAVPEQIEWSGENPGDPAQMIDPDNPPAELAGLIGCLTDYVTSFGAPEVLDLGEGEEFDALMEAANEACADAEPPAATIEELGGGNDESFVFESVIEE